ncbi:TetR/AcrR family transcriptional regulator [Paenibacillus fonticola]|uniref:TetR/AcrR family transcriptional regulator n=1 Tax=Paenibacillus fonticola TaxID=379896 RepID=UPI00035CAF86|nr:TetR-like C-terminal domain-containing protein [Paenibacillus fonticola]
MAFDYRDDKRSIRSKEQLKEALFELLYEKEWRQITIQHLTKKAKLNRSTFYQHYENKYDLLVQNIDDLFQSLKESVLSTSIDNSSADTISYAYLLAFYRHLKEQSYYFKVILNRGYELDIMELFSDIVQEAMGQVVDVQQAIDGVPAEIHWRYSIAAHFSVASWWLQNDLPYSPEFMAEAVLKLTKEGKHHALLKN